MKSPQRAFLAVKKYIGLNKLRDQAVGREFPLTYGPRVKAPLVFDFFNAYDVGALEIRFRENHLDLINANELFREKDLRAVDLGFHGNFFQTAHRRAHPFLQRRRH
jgi:hypothetical protein